MTGFVVIEGIDGCGKSSAAEAVARSIGSRAFLTREPTDSWIGDAVRKGDASEMSPYADALLFMADRAQHTLEIAELVRSGKLVVCDRYYHSTVAYQSASLRRKSLGDNFDWLLDANTKISIRPDVTFVLVVDPDTALRRISGRPELSRFEEVDFLREVQANYHRLAEVDDTVVEMDADRDQESIVRDILLIIHERKL
jgi:dTMP kinase